jgi:hypothetical protein
MNHDVFCKNNTHSHVVSVGYTKILEFFMNHQVFHESTSLQDSNMDSYKEVNKIVIS